MSNPINNHQDNKLGGNPQDKPYVKFDNNAKKGGGRVHGLLVKQTIRTCASILYLLGLIFAFFFIIWLWPNYTASLSWVVILVFLGMIIISSVRQNYKKYKQGKYSRSRFILKTFVDVVGILLITILAIILAGASARYVGQLIGNAVESTRQGLGVRAGILAALITAVFVGLCVGYIGRAVWNRLTKPIRGNV